MSYLAMVIWVLRHLSTCRNTCVLNLSGRRGGLVFLSWVISDRQGHAEIVLYHNSVGEEFGEKRILAVHLVLFCVDLCSTMMAPGCTESRENACNRRCCVGYRNVC